MITIGQLARYVGVSVKTIRVYHAKGLLPEPGRDDSGYRRYAADDVVAVIKIRTLSQAGVPLARVRQLLDAPPDDVTRALSGIDDDLDRRIQLMRATQVRLRELAAGTSRPLPAEVHQHLAQLSTLGFTDRWVTLERDLWILVFVTRPDIAPALFRDQTESLTDPGLLRLYLDYDSVHDLDPDHPEIAALARRIVRATRQRYGAGELPGQATGSDLPGLVQDAVNARSPAWTRLDTLIRDGLRVRSA